MTDIRPSLCTTVINNRADLIIGLSCRSCLFLLRLHSPSHLPRRFWSQLPLIDIITISGALRLCVAGDNKKIIKQAHLQSLPTLFLKCGKREGERRRNPSYLASVLLKPSPYRRRRRWRCTRLVRPPATHPYEHLQPVRAAIISEQLASASPFFFFFFFSLSLYVILLPSCLPYR
ncbi:hypothetical protein F5Y14DRAFT_431082, partial [Nemania sp. NC0429]